MPRDCRGCKHNRFSKCLTNNDVFKARWEYFNKNTEELDEDVWEEIYQDGLLKHPCEVPDV